MFNLDLESAEEVDIKLTTSIRSTKMQQSSRKPSSSAFLTTVKHLRDSPETVENSSRDGNTRPSYLPPEKLYAGQEATVRTGHGTTD